MMLIGNAYAEAARRRQSAESGFSADRAGGGVLFSVLRPQSKRAKEQKAMISALQRGDEVVTGGEVGSVNKVGNCRRGTRRKSVVMVQKRDPERAAERSIINKGLGWD